MMTFLLIDEYNNHAYDFIAEQIDCEIVYPHTLSKKKIHQWLNGCWIVMKKVRAHDRIVCVYDFQAIICYYLSALMLKRVSIICVNILLKDKLTIRNRIVSILYKYAIKSNRITATVTSVEYGIWLKKKLKIDKEFVLLRDIYHEDYQVQFHQMKGNTVFCGGRNGRDWKFMIGLANALPDVNFIFVMPEEAYYAFSQYFPANISVYHNISNDKFMELLCLSALVCLPLDTEAPAGLIVMFQAAANEKMILSTDTVVTRGYVTSERGVLLKNELDAWKYAITYYLAHSEECKTKAGLMKEYLQTECSELRFVSDLKYILDHD